MNTDLHFSSATDDWATPPEFFAEVQRRLGKFDLDVCADKANAKCERFISAEQDGLSQRWCLAIDQTTRRWCNSPYGRVLPKWIDKAIEEVRLGGVSVTYLAPARTDTRWFYKAFRAAKVVWFIKGRLKFGGHVSSAPFPSVLFLFDGGPPVDGPRVICGTLEDFACATW